MKTPQVLIVSGDAEFVRQIVSCWEREQNAPNLTVVSPEIMSVGSPVRCPVAIVGPFRNGGPVPPNAAVSFGTSVCAIVESHSRRSIQQQHPDWLIILEQPGWPEVLFGLVREVERRTAAEARAENAEKTDSARRQLAAVGGLLMDERPALVNVLTSLVGNADLMMLSADPLSADTAEQTRTIHAMALRLSEMLHRIFVLSCGTSPTMHEHSMSIEEICPGDESAAGLPSSARRVRGATPTRGVHD